MSNIPIYRAKKIDSDEFIEGFYSPRFFMCFSDDICDTISDRDGRQFEIDLSTLAISFDNGLTWRSLIEVQSALHLQDSSGCYE